MERLDVAIVRLGLAGSRERAQGLIQAGMAQVDGQPAARASLLVGPDAKIEITGEALPYVGRGGLKMDAALRRFRLNVTGALCLDIGASTGGFTDCLLQRGAARVIAVDVGHDQLAPSLRADPRVDLREGVNARNLTAEDVPEQVDLAVIDVAFISLTLILPAVAPLVRKNGHILALVKPQYEAGREAVGVGGIVRSPKDRQRGLDRVLECGQQKLGLELRGCMAVPQTMGRGNLEFAACFRIPGDKPPEDPTVEPAPEPTGQVVF